MPLLIKDKKFVNSVLIDRNKVFNKVQNKIIDLLLKKEMYPLEIASKLGINEQNVYYNIKTLREMGVIEVVRTEKVRNLRKFYGLTSDAMSVIFRNNWKSMGPRLVNDAYFSFFERFMKDGKFDGSIVVGAPFEHGPYLTISKDGHYAVQLAFFLGSFISLPKRFVVKLDTEVKAEEAFKRNLILVGGPITNVVTYELNKKLPVKFNWKSQWELISKSKKYNGVFDGVIEKIENPWSKDHEIILIAGLHSGGTKAAILGLTQHPNMLSNFNTFKVIRGIDRDGDGKVDDIKIMEED